MTFLKKILPVLFLGWFCDSGLTAEPPRLSALEIQNHVEKAITQVLSKTNKLPHVKWRSLLVSPRTWIDITEKFTVDASFVRLEEALVTLRKEDGKEVTLPLSKLSVESREAVRVEALSWGITAKHEEELDALDMELRKLQAKLRRRTLISAVRREAMNEVSVAEAKMAQLIASCQQEIRTIGPHTPFVQVENKLFTPQEIEAAEKAQLREILEARVQQRMAEAEAAAEARMAEADAAEEARWRQTNGTARLAADGYITQLLQDGTLKEAVFTRELKAPKPLDLVIGGVFSPPSGVQNTAIYRDHKAMTDPARGAVGWKAVSYHVKYVSRAGISMERDSHVLVFQRKDGLWFTWSFNY